MEKPKIHISESQTFLLKTIVCEKSKVAVNYQNWIVSVNMDNYIDGESYAIIPALYKRLEEIDLVDINISKYMGIYKKSFYKNGLFLSLLQQIGGELNIAGIPFILLKGLPLIINYYNDIGIRSMADIDICVDRENFPKAIEILNRLGFYCNTGFDILKNIEIRHSYSFKNEKGMEIDLYWTVLPVSFLHIPIGEPRQFVFKNVQCSMLSPEDFILQDCLHGASIDPVHIRWVFDLYTIIKNEPNISWNILLDKLKETSHSYVSVKYKLT